MVGFWWRREGHECWLVVVFVCVFGLVELVCESGWAAEEAGLEGSGVVG